MTLKVKIHSLDEANGTVLASFADERSLKSIDEYDSYCFSLDGLDKGIQGLMEIMYDSGRKIVDMQHKAESPNTQSLDLDELKSMIGKVIDLDSNFDPRSQKKISLMNDLLVV